MKFRIVLAAVAVTLLAGCMGTTMSVPRGGDAAVEAERLEQDVVGHREFMRKVVRLNRAAHPILSMNVDLCPRKTFADGYFVATTTGDWEAATYIRLYGAAPITRPVVTHVFDGSPAERAGLEVGDVLVGINEWRVPELKKRNRIKVAKEIHERSTANGAGPYTHHVVRDGKPLALEFPPLTPYCDYHPVLLPADELNAFADGELIYLTNGMMRFLDRDQDLQAVIAHELAHNTQGHVGKSKANTAIGGIFGALVDVALCVGSYGASCGTSGTELGMGLGRRAHSKGFEREADYISVYMMERAGVDASEVSDLWRKMAAESGGSKHSVTHPTSAERYVNLREAHEEVVRKRNAGTPLVPNPKSAD